MKKISEPLSLTRFLLGYSGMHKSFSSSFDQWQVGNVLLGKEAFVHLSAPSICLGSNVGDSEWVTGSPK
jgi:hypothetical protein